MAIKIWDYLKEYHEERKEILAAAEEVFESGRLILGPKVEAFERRYSEYCGVKYSVGVDNGTNAIFLALKALGIGEGDEVITVSNTAIPTVSAIVSTGATPVFVDILEESFLMDTSKIEGVITSRTKCILPVHLFGQCTDMDQILAIANKFNLFVVEDCAQSHGTVYKGKIAGSLGHLSTTSFYPTKILGAYGDGGMISTHNEDLYKKLRRLRFYGSEKTYYAIEHGYNSRLDEIQASILLVKLNKLDNYIKRRRELADKYNVLLKDSGLILPKEMVYGKHAYYLYVVRHEERDFILEELKKKDILLNISYPWPIHIMTGYHYLGYKEGDFPITEKMAKEIFSLPMYPSLTDEEQLTTCNTLIDIINNL
jgi:dTDP-3-amino-2,3,6-trideoxy-4-keto-D-glucose/dTDP-3-amino-3,4,6-trideoxy-alpha-D-glucose/dTDP-2,6-dideoxy-D-kanosamine transaminase